MSELVATDFLLPDGQLDPAQFDGVDLSAYVAVWIGEVEDSTEDDRVIRAWVYHRAFSLLADRFHAGVATAREGDVSGTKSSEQFEFWRERSAREFRRYKSLVGVGVTW